MRIVALAMITFALVACSDREGAVESDPSVRASETAAGGDGVSEAKDDGPVGARTVSLETELYSFRYTYPEEIGKRQGLRMVLDRQLEQARTALIQQAREAKKAADAGEKKAADPAKKKSAVGKRVPFRPHSLSTEWSIAAKPEGWLSLFAETSTYYGGAHPDTTYDSLVWSDAAIKSFAPVDLFASAAALRGAIRRPFCARLNEEREKRRGEPVDPASDELFDRCIDPTDKAVIVLASSDGKAFDRLRIDVPPYAAGPYAEGTFHIDLPVTAKLLAAVKPNYRTAFAVYSPPKADDAAD